MLKISSQGGYFLLKQQEDTDNSSFGGEGGKGGGERQCSSYPSAYISRVQNTNPPTSPLDVCDCTVVFIPRECAAVVLELKNLPRPRSPSFTTAEAVTNTLAGLMSKHGRICMCECVYVSVNMCV